MTRPTSRMSDAQTTLIKSFRETLESHIQVAVSVNNYIYMCVKTCINALCTP